MLLTRVLTYDNIRRIRSPGTFYRVCRQLKIHNIFESNNIILYSTDYLYENGSFTLDVNKNRYDNNRDRFRLNQCVIISPRQKL